MRTLVLLSLVSVACSNNVPADSANNLATSSMDDDSAAGSGASSSNEPSSGESSSDESSSDVDEGGDSVVAT